MTNLPLIFCANQSHTDLQFSMKGGVRKGRRGNRTRTANLAGNEECGARIDTK